MGGGRKIIHVASLLWIWVPFQLEILERMMNWWSSVSVVKGSRKSGVERGGVRWLCGEEWGGKGRGMFCVFDGGGEWTGKRPASARSSNKMITVVLCGKHLIWGNGSFDLFGPLPSRWSQLFAVLLLFWALAYIVGYGITAFFKWRVVWGADGGITHGPLRSLCCAFPLPLLAGWRARQRIRFEETSVWRPTRQHKVRGPRAWSL